MGLWSFKSIVNFMSAGAWSIGDHDPSPMLIQWEHSSNPSSISCQLVLVHWNWPWSFAHVNSVGLPVLQIHVNFMSTGAWSMEIDHDPSPMLIQ
jgi:hypothetical protein